MFLKIKQYINSVQNCFAAELFLRDMKYWPDEITLHILKSSYISILYKLQMILSIQIQLYNFLYILPFVRK